MSLMPPFDLVLFISLILLGIVLITLAIRHKKARKQGRKTAPGLLLSISGLAIVLSAVLMVREFQQRAPYRYDPAADQALGRTLADLFVNNDVVGSQIVLVSWGAPHNEEMAVNPMAKTRLNAFVEALQERGLEAPAKISPVSLAQSAGRLSATNPDYLLEDFWFIEGGLPYWMLTELWQQFPESRVFVSLEGFPREKLSELSEQKPEGSLFYALDMFGYGYFDLDLSDSPIDGVVVMRLRDSDKTYPAESIPGLENFLILRP